MRSNVVVIHSHPITELRCPNIAIEAPDNLRPLPESPIQSPHNVIVWFRLEVFQPDMRILNTFIQAVFTSHLNG